MTYSDMTKLLGNFFKDSDGKYVLWQWPNIPLYGWVIFMALHRITSNTRLEDGFRILSIGFIFTWAYLEITEGISYFRKFLGLVVLAVTVVSFFK